MDSIEVGGIVSAATYLTGVIFASVMAGNHPATVLALASAAVAVFCYTAQLAGRPPQGVALITYFASNVLAGLAGAVLVLGYLA